MSDYGVVGGDRQPAPHLLPQQIFIEARGFLFVYLFCFSRKSQLGSKGSKS